MPDETQPEEGKKTKSKKSAPPTVKVRVKGTQPLHEAGVIYNPETKKPNKAGGLDTVPADVFEVTEERLEALGDSVELIPG